MLMIVKYRSYVVAEAATVLPRTRLGAGQRRRADVTRPRQLRQRDGEQLDGIVQRRLGCLRQSTPHR